MKRKNAFTTRTIIHLANSKYIIIDGKVKKKCKLKHHKDDAGMCGECLRLNNIDVYPGKKKHIASKPK